MFPGQSCSGKAYSSWSGFLVFLDYFLWVCPKTGGRRTEETCNWMKNSWFTLSCWSQQMVLTAFAHVLEKPYIIRQLVYGIYQGTAIRLTATCHFSERWRIGFWKQNTSHNVESFRISTPYDFGCFHELFSQNDALPLSQQLVRFVLLLGFFSLKLERVRKRASHTISLDVF